MESYRDWKQGERNGRMESYRFRRQDGRDGVDYRVTRQLEAVKGVKVRSYEEGEGRERLFYDGGEGDVG